MHAKLLLSCWFAFLLGCLVAQGSGDDSPGFFLKITKNVPRLGRRAEKNYDNYFMRNMKVIPRIGRRVGEMGTDGGNPVAKPKDDSDDSELLTWLNDISLPPNKRMIMNHLAAAAAAEREYSVVQPVNVNTLIELLEKDAIPSENVKFVHWKDFDRALQLDTELYAKVISLGRRPDHRLREDLRFVNRMPMYNDPINENIANGDYMLYNKGQNEEYTGKYGRNFLHSNYLK